MKWSSASLPQFPLLLSSCLSPVQKQNQDSWLWCSDCTVPRHAAHCWLLRLQSRYGANPSPHALFLPHVFTLLIGNCQEQLIHVLCIVLSSQWCYVGSTRQYSYNSFLRLIFYHLTSFVAGPSCLLCVIIVWAQWLCLKMLMDTKMLLISRSHCLDSPILTLENEEF